MSLRLLYIHIALKYTHSSSVSLSALNMRCSFEAFGQHSEASVQSSTDIAWQAFRVLQRGVMPGVSQL